MRLEDSNRARFCLAPRGEELHLRGPGVQVRADGVQEDPREGAGGYLLQPGWQGARAPQH